MVIDFIKAKILFDAFSSWASAEQYPSLQAAAAQPLIDAAKEHGSFFTEESIRAICHPLDALNAMILDAEVDDDPDLADDLRHNKERVTVHVARRIAEALTGKSTTIARQLKASIHANARKYPSDFDLKARPFGEVVPLNGKAQP